MENKTEFKKKEKKSYRVLEKHISNSLSTIVHMNKCN